MYYKLTIQQFNDNTPEASSLLAYETKAAAAGAAFSDLSSASTNGKISKCICKIIDSDGAIHRHDEWKPEIN